MLHATLHATASTSQQQGPWTVPTVSAPKKRRGSVKMKLTDDQKRAFCIAMAIGITPPLVQRVFGMNRLDIAKVVQLGCYEYTKLSCFFAEQPPTATGGPYKSNNKAAIRALGAYIRALKAQPFPRDVSDPVLIHLEQIAKQLEACCKENETVDLSRDHCATHPGDHIVQPVCPDTPLQDPASTFQTNSYMRLGEEEKDELAERVDQHKEDILLVSLKTGISASTIRKHRIKRKRERKLDDAREQALRGQQDKSNPDFAEQAFSTYCSEGPVIHEETQDTTTTLSPLHPTLEQVTGYIDPRDAFRETFPASINERASSSSVPDNEHVASNSPSDDACSDGEAMNVKDQQQATIKAKRIRIAQSIKDGQIGIQDGAKQLQVQPRQMQKIMNSFLRDGEEGIILLRGWKKKRKPKLCVEQVFAAPFPALHAPSGRRSRSSSISKSVPGPSVSYPIPQRIDLDANFQTEREAFAIALAIGLTPQFLKNTFRLKSERMNEIIKLADHKEYGSGLRILPFLPNNQNTTVKPGVTRSKSSREPAQALLAYVRDLEQSPDQQEVSPQVLVKLKEIAEKALSRFEEADAAPLPKDNQPTRPGSSAGTSSLSIPSVSYPIPRRIDVDANFQTEREAFAIALAIGFTPQFLKNTFRLNNKRMDRIIRLADHEEYGSGLRILQFLPNDPNTTVKPGVKRSKSSREPAQALLAYVRDLEQSSDQQEVSPQVLVKLKEIAEKAVSRFEEAEAVPLPKDTQPTRSGSSAGTSSLSISSNTPSSLHVTNTTKESYAPPHNRQNAPFAAVAESNKGPFASSFGSGHASHIDLGSPSLFLNRGTATGSVALPAVATTSFSLPDWPGAGHPVANAPFSSGSAMPVSYSIPPFTSAHSSHSSFPPPGWPGGSNPVANCPFPAGNATPVSYSMPSFTSAHSSHSPFSLPDWPGDSNPVANGPFPARSVTPVSYSMPPFTSAHSFH